jgi:hypothetical protein
VICLDTSALVKLYLLEEGSSVVQNLISSQSDPLPVWELQEMELTNALRLKVFWKEISETGADHQLALFGKRKEKGHYYFPDIDRAALFQPLSDCPPTRRNSDAGHWTSCMSHVPACSRPTCLSVSTHAKGNWR